MKTNNNFSKFIANLEQKMINNDQEMILLSKNIDANFGAGAIVINGEQCVNGSSACQGSINGTRCSNSDCNNSSNSKKCTVLQPSTGIF